MLHVKLQTRVSPSVFSHCIDSRGGRKIESHKNQDSHLLWFWINSQIPKIIFLYVLHKKATRWCTAQTHSSLKSSSSKKSNIWANFRLINLKISLVLAGAMNGPANKCTLHCWAIISRTPEHAGKFPIHGTFKTFGQWWWSVNYTFMSLLSLSGRGL